MLKTAVSPESAGVSSKGLLAYLAAIEKSGIEHHGVIVLRRGEIVLDAAWRPYTNQTPHILFSLSKSFTSTAIGLAQAEGLLNVTDTVYSHLPDKFPENPSPRHLQLTIHDLLCMGSGLAPESDGARAEERDWAKRALSFPIEHEPGTHFHYNSMNSYLCSAIVQRKAGQTMRDYLMPRLFTPLGIEKPQWSRCPEGVNCGGWGLRLSTEDIAKFGQLILQDGVWEGKRLLPEGWVKTATTKKIDNYVDDNTNEWQQGYCYQFWRCRDGHFRGDGMYGQILWIMPEKETVVAITAGTEDMGGEMALIHDYLIPAIDAPAANRTTQEELVARVANLSYPLPRLGRTPPYPLSGKYTASDGAWRKLSFEGDTLQIAFCGEEERFTLRYDRGRYRKNTVRTPIPGEPPLTCHAAYGWDKNTLKTVARMVNAPMSRIAELVFDETGFTETVRGAGFTAEEKHYDRA